MQNDQLTETRDYTFRAYGRSTIIAVVMTSFITTFMSSALNLSIPTLERYFSANATTISWAVTGYIMTVAATSVIFGKLADMTDRYKWLISGISIFLVITVITVFTTSVRGFITMRILQALGAAMIFATNIAVLLSSYPGFMRGKALGYQIAGTYIGLTAGPVFGGQLQNAFGWKSIFIASAIFTVASLVATIMSYMTKKKKAQSKGHDMSSDDTPMKSARFDIVGTVLYVTGIPLSLFGLSELSVRKGSVYLMILGLALIIAFVLYEKKVSSPVVDIRMFSRSRSFSFSILATALNYCATYAISYLMSIYLQLVKGMDPGRAGLLMIVMPAMQAIFSPFMGTLSDKVRAHVLASTGMGITTVMLLFLSRITTDTPLGYIIVIMTITGFGFAVFSSPNMNTIMADVDKRDYSVANSIIATARTYGQTTGMSALNIVIGIMLGTASFEASTPESIVEVIRISFIVFTGIGIVGVLASLVRNKSENN